MQMIQRWLFLVTTALVLVALAGCGVPTSSTSTQPTVGAEPPTATTAPAEAATKTALTPETPPVPGTTATPEDSTAPTGAANQVDGTTWQLAEWGPADGMTAASGEVTVTFGPGDKIGGNSGCNSYGGTYALDGSTLRVSNVASTMMACLDPALMQQESAFNAALTTATELTVDGDELRIAYPGGAMRFTRVDEAAAPALEGTTWHLESIVTGTGASATASSPVVGTAVTAEWNGGSVRGNAGCNRYSANYTLDRETLAVGDVITTHMACDGPIMEQEQTVLDALDAATGLKIDNGKLLVSFGDGSLVFAPAAR